MPPILQTPITLTLRILLRLVLLRKMPLTIRNHAPHVIDVFLLVFLRIFLRILLQDGNDFAAAFVADCFVAAVVFRPGKLRELGGGQGGEGGRGKLYQPEPADSSCPSQSSSSEASMFTISLNSLVFTSYKLHGPVIMYTHKSATHLITVSLSLTILHDVDEKCETCFDGYNCNCTREKLGSCKTRRTLVLKTFLVCHFCITS